MLIYVLALLSTITLTWLGYKKPKLALYIIIALLPSYLLRLKIWFIPITILEILILSTFLGVILRNFNKTYLNQTKKSLKKLYQNFTIFLFPLGLILISSVTAIIISSNKIQALGIAKAYFWEPLIFLILTLLYWQKENVITTIKFFIPSAVIINFLAIQQYLFKQGILEYTEFNQTWRSIGPFKYPNAIGLFLAPITILFIYLVINYWQNKKYLKSTLSILLILLNLASIYFAQSEAALLALAISIFFLLLHHRLLKYFIIIITILSSIFIFYHGWHNKIINKLLLNDFSGQIRRQIYTESSEMLSHNLLWGAGLASYQTAISNYHLDVLIMKQGTQLFEQPVEIYLYPHNIILNFWTEIGLLGMIAFIFLFLYFIIKNYQYYLKKHKPLYLILNLTFLTIIIHGLFDVPYFKNDLAVLFWFLITISLINWKTEVTKT